MTSNEIINILKTGLDENEIQNLYVNEIVREPGAKGFIRINNMWFIYGNQDERGNISFNAQNGKSITFTDSDGKILFPKEVIRCYGFHEGYAVVVLRNFDSAILDEKGNISERHFEQLGQRFSEERILPSSWI